MNLLLLFTLISQERPVIRLDDSRIEGEIRRPKIIELEGTDLDKMIQEVALKNLIRLEVQLLKPNPRYQR